MPRKNSSLSSMVVLKNMQGAKKMAGDASPGCSLSTQNEYKRDKLVILINDVEKCAVRTTGTTAH